MKRRSLLLGAAASALSAGASLLAYLVLAVLIATPVIPQQQAHAFGIGHLGLGHMGRTSAGGVAVSPHALTDENGSPLTDENNVIITDESA